MNNANANTQAPRTENVLGDQLKVGDIVWSSGYRWRLASVKLEARGNHEGQSRTFCTAEAADEAEAKRLGGYGRGMTLGLRSDLAWLRELPQA